MLEDCRERQQRLLGSAAAAAGAADGPSTELFNMKLQIQQLQVSQNASGWRGRSCSSGPGCSSACVLSPLYTPSCIAQQEKVAFLAGGTDAEQLVDLLMEKEEEGRAKDRALLELQHEMAALKVRCHP
jgi:hypothetical protein